MTNRLISILFLQLCMLASYSYGQSTNIYGRNAKLKGKTLVLERFRHKLFEHNIVLDSARVDSAGNFSFNINPAQVQQVSVNLGTYSMQFFVLPNDSVEVSLPAFSPLSRSKLYDPYFKPEQYLLVPENGNSKQLNSDIYTFEVFYDSIYQNSMRSVALYKNDTIPAKALQASFNKQHDDTFLSEYKWYTSASLFKMAHPFSKDSLILRYFSREEPAFNNPAFWDAFNVTFKNALTEDGSEKLLPQMLGPIWKSKYARLQEEVSGSYKLNNADLTDLVALKGIYDVWFKLPDLRPLLEELLKQATVQITHKQNQKIAFDILHELTNLLPGKKAPAYILRKANGDELNLTQPNKNIVLGFISPELLQCRNDIVSMDAFYEMLDKDYAIEFINVVVHQKEKDFQTFMDQYKGKLSFIYWQNDKDLLNSYKIKQLPAYYLISPDGTIISNPDSGGLNTIFKTIKTH